VLILLTLFKGFFMLGTPLHKFDMTKKYDAIIIGSGISSLILASILSRKGQKALVLEKHYTPGGYTHTFKRKGYEWDVGVHYVGDVHKEYGTSKKLFDYTTDGSLKWAHMGESYDRIIFPDKSVTFKTGKQNLEKELIKAFPDEAKAIQKYLKLVQTVSKTSSLFFLNKLIPEWVSKLVGKKLTKSFDFWVNKSTKEVLDSLTNNEQLKAILVGQWGDYGLPPGESPFVMQAMVAKHYFDGGSYPVGGSSRIAESMIPIIRKSGGDVVFNAAVKEVIVKKKTAIGIKLENGKSIFAKKIVSGAGLYLTSQLLGSSTDSASGFMSASQTNKSEKKYSLFNWPLQFVKPSASHICLHIGLDKTAEELNLSKENLWIYPGYNHDKNVREYIEGRESEFPVVYTSFPSAKDPDFSKNYPGKGTIEMITMVPYQWYEKWEGTKWKKRGEEYLKHKEELSQRLLAHLYKHVPAVEGHVKFYELSTPLSTKNFCSYKSGEIYGIEHSKERFLSSYPRSKTPIKNFYLTGQDLTTGGVSGAMASGAFTAISMLGWFRSREVLSIIFEKKVKNRSKSKNNAVSETLLATH